MVKVNLLAISVGNTRCRIGAYVDGNLVECATLENGLDDRLGEAIEHAFNPLRERQDAGVLISSVNPVVADRVETLASARLGRQVERVERDYAIPIGRQLDREALVGEDRLLNAAAAFDVLKQACVVIDAGTAITVDLVDGSGTFHGGAIAPGAQLMLDSLHSRTALLPEVEFVRPHEVPGHNTVEAMRVGSFFGLRGVVRELVEQYAEHLGAFPTVIATGGDADVLFREWELVDRIVPDLTLTGIAVTWRVAIEQADRD